MKLRHGFVSNSSTTSFIIYGTYIEDQNKITREMYSKISDSKLMTGFGSNEVFGDSQGIYIGQSWSDVLDDETGKQFKERIENKIKDILDDKSLKFETYKEAYYGG